ncbi:DUF6371 domain-containing protein [Winogradskyella pulchriflava]|uniref:DUF6371 domain-containing protein n=1 Tax=Winogradskyella pulchriflava TaxID=1110688 RepID=A0ABV6QB10_9FLAO
MNFKYKLDPTSKKFYCPACGKKSFVCYIEVATNKYLESTIGRCDRESKCAYHKTPKGNLPISSTCFIQQPKTPTYHTDDVIGYYGRDYNNNKFVSYLKQHFAPRDIKSVIQKYFIGTSSHWKGATVFWQIDHKMNVHAGKVMLYNPFTGNRVKKPFNHINWMHRVLQINNFVLQQCLFGIHNLCDFDSDSTVCIVESEKTAIVMSLLYPQFLWLATGSKSNLKLDLLQPLKGYKIIVYPDKLEYNDWKIKVQNFKNLGYNIICSYFVEKLSVCEGADLADVLI